MLNFFLKGKNGIFTKFTLLAFLMANLLIPAITPALGQEYSPEYPTRIKAIAEELSGASGELVAMNQDLKTEASQCSCNNSSVVSLCVQKKGFATSATGDPCKNNRENIEEIQIAIRNKIDQVSYLIALLEVEMQSGLEDELKTLPEEDAIILKTGLDNLLISSNDLIAPSESNTNIMDSNNYSSQNKCQAKCNRSFPLSFEVCVGAQGEQKPIEMDFRVSASLQKIDLGKIEISKIGLNLPDKIKLTSPSLLNNFSMALPDISIEFPPTPMKDLANVGLSPIILRSFTASLPSFNAAEFSCNQPNSSQYSCQDGEKNSVSYVDIGWYAQTFSWLSEKCQALPAMKNNMGMPIEEKYKQCFDEKSVQTTINNECDAIWSDYNRCLNKIFAHCDRPTETCWDIKQSGTGKRLGVERSQCSVLFQGQNEPVPTECNSNPIETLKNKCEAIKKSGEETIPEPCLYIPIFTGGAMPDLSTQYFQSDKNTCDPQIISDNSLFSAGANCGISASLNRDIATPQIKLPGVKIPDIRLPSFSFMPFLKVKLPNFIFEDLAFPDMDLCNINDCMDTLSGGFNLNVPMPTLRIPNIELPPIYASLGIPGVDAKIKIEMDKMRFPEIQMPMPEFDLLKFASPKITLPKISTPLPQIKVEFKGVKINLPNLLLGLIGSIFNIPGGCIGFGFGLSGLPLEIIFPDYYFYWPKFPRIPNLCENANLFCRQLKNSLDEAIGDKMSALANATNSPIQSGIQQQLDQISTIYQTVITRAVSDKMNEIKNTIEITARNITVYKNGMVSIPRTTIPLGWITVPMNGINSELSQIPLEIRFNWPSELKELSLTNTVSYQLPSIPLDDLNFSKDVKLKLPGLQLPSFSFGLNFSDDYVDIAGQPPDGGNPYPIDELNSNIETITEKSNEITDASDNISNVLK